MNPVAFMRELVAKGMSWEDAAEIAERFEVSVTARVAEALAAAAPRRSKAAERQATYRAKKNNDDNNADHNAERNAEHNGVDNGVDNAGDAPLSLPPSPQTPQPPTHTRESNHTREGAREDAAFGRFWEAYPRKVSKAEARKAFGKAWRKLPPHDEEAVLIGGLERAKAAWTEAQFIPHAATWLKGERWNDEPSLEPSPRKANDRPHNDRQPTARQDRLSRMLSGALAAADGEGHVFPAGGDGARPLLPRRTGTDG